MLDRWLRIPFASLFGGTIGGGGGGGGGNRLLLESSPVDGYLLEDGSGVLLQE